MHWIKIWILPFLMGTTSSITVQSLGKIVQCAPTVAAKMWCFFCHAPSPELRAFEACIFRTTIPLPITGQGPILMRFSAFFQKGVLFQRHYMVLIFVTRCCHNFHEIAVKNYEKSKKGKVCAHHFL